MRFKFVKRMGLIALSAAIPVMFAHAALRAEDDDNSKAGTGAASALKIKDQSSGERRRQEMKAQEFKRERAGEEFARKRIEIGRKSDRFARSSSHIGG